MSKHHKHKKPIQDNTHDITPDLDNLLDRLVVEQNMETVKLVVDGIEVGGIVLQKSESDFEIAITKPYQNLTTGSHIPYFARDVLSFKGEYGDDSIKATLRYLYELGKHLAEKMELLKNKLADYDDQVSDEFFEDNFPMEVPFETRFQVLDILKGDRQLIL